MIHFNDNLEENISNDRFYKIRPLLEKVRQNCMKYFFVGETTIPYKGTGVGNLRQYIQNKPNKWEFKLFVMAA